MSICTINEKMDAIVSLGNMQITGKDCILKEFRIEMDNSMPTYFGLREPLEAPPGLIELTLTLVTTTTNAEGEGNLIQKFWEKDFKPKIRHKKVEDCSIQELLFAAREKIRRGE